ncbi:MAG TPA: hypothetical protein VGU23_09710 [Acidobacteriaceae bacterium]|nr:hypothetical protein [Acidobacteriaceae bacterium]
MCSLIYTLRAGVLLALLPLTHLVFTLAPCRHMPAYQASADRTYHGVMSRIVPGYPSYQGTFEATSGV